LPYGILVSALRFVDLRQPELGLFLCCRMSSQLSKLCPRPLHHNQEKSQQTLDLFNSSASLRHIGSIDYGMLLTAQCSGLHAVGKDAVSPVFVTLPGRLAGFSGTRTSVRRLLKSGNVVFSRKLQSCLRRRQGIIILDAERWKIIVEMIGVNSDFYWWTLWGRNSGTLMFLA
jgi:hypothetical protein